MPKGRYKVVPSRDYQVPNDEDNSFYICICTLLIFFLIILFILSLPLIIRTVSDVYTDNYSETKVGKLHGDKLDTKHDPVMTQGTSQQTPTTTKQYTSAISIKTTKRPNKEPTSFVNFLTTPSTNNSITIKNSVTEPKTTAKYTSESTLLTTLKYVTITKEGSTKLNTIRTVTNDTTTNTLSSIELDHDIDLSTTLTTTTRDLLTDKVDLISETYTEHEKLNATTTTHYEIFTTEDSTVSSKEFPTTFSTLNEESFGYNYSTPSATLAISDFMTTDEKTRRAHETVTTDSDNSTSTSYPDEFTYYSTTTSTESTATSFDSPTTYNNKDVISTEPFTTSEKFDSTTPTNYLTDNTTTILPETESTVSYAAERSDENHTISIESMAYESTISVSTEATSRNKTDLTSLTTSSHDDIDETTVTSETTIGTRKTTTDTRETTIETRKTTTDIRETTIIPLEKIYLNSTTETILLNVTTSVSGPILCNTNICKTEASRILSYINYTFDYCHDFYEYACGEMRHSNAVLDVNNEEYINKIIKDEIDKIDDSRPLPEKNLKKFYLSCMNYEHISPKIRKHKGKQLFNNMGTMLTAEDGVADLTKLVINLIQIGSFPIFDVTFDVNDLDSNKLQLKLSLPEHDHVLMFENEKAKECRNVLRKTNKVIALSDVYEIEYLRCMKNHSEFIKTTGEALEVLHVFNRGETQVEIQKILMTVEDKLFNLYEMLPPLGRIREILSAKTYDIMTVDELQNKFGFINWKQLFQTLLEQKMYDHTQVQIYFKTYFENVFALLSKKKDLWKVHNALLANFAYNIYKYFIKLENACNREQYCITITSRLIPDVTSNLFLGSFEENVLNKKHNEIMSVFESIRNTMLEEVDEGTWLDELSVEAVKLKINALQMLLPSIIDPDWVEKQFLEFQITDDDYIANTMELIKRKHNMLYSIYSMPPNSQHVMWLLFASSYSSDSAYIYNLNILAVPETVVMQYNQNLPAAVNMARVGNVIARGFARAFDKTGIYFNYKHDHAKPVITDDSYIIYDMMLITADSLFSYLLSHKEDEVYYNFKLSASMTMNERLSDVSATKLALETLRRKSTNKSVFLWGDFTEEQLYYLTSAQTFCNKKFMRDLFPTLFESETLPPFLRIRSMFSNSEEFNKSFPCPIGSSMNSQVRISAFPLLSNPFDY